MRNLIIEKLSIQRKHPRQDFKALSLLEIAVVALFVLSAFSQISAAYAASPAAAPVMTVSVNTGTSVTSGGVQEPYIIMQVASSSNPSVVYQVTGARLAQRVVGGAYKSYFYLYVNSGKTFAVNTTGEVAKDTISGYSTTNLYWNVQTPPNSGGSTSFYGTIGQDLDLGATSNTLSEWQWVDLNYGGGAKPISYTGSYDGGGPTACYVYSNNQMRESVYVIIVDSSSKTVYHITGAELNSARHQRC